MNAEKRINERVVLGNQRVVLGNREGSFRQMEVIILKKKGPSNKVTVIDNETGEIVRYSNKLLTYDVAQMSPRAQDLMTLFFVYFRKTEESNLEIPFSVIRKKLNLTKQTFSYFEKVLAGSVYEILNNRKLFKYTPGVGFFGGSLITYVDGDSKREILQIILNEKFLAIFKDCAERYVEYSLGEFFQIKSKYSKNLFRLLHTYFHGVCTISNKELRDWMDMSEAMNSKDVVKIINKAAGDLLNKNCITSFDMETHYSKNGLESISFKFSFPDKKEKQLNPGGSGKQQENQNNSVKSNSPAVPIQGIPEEQALANAYFEKIGQLKGKNEMDRLAVCLQVHGLLDCLQAIEIAKQNGGRSVAYIERVLENGIHNKPKSRGWQMPGIHADLSKRDPDLQEIPF